MKTLIRGLAALSILGLITMGLAACLHDADADSPSGPTQAEFDALAEQVNALEAAIAGLEAGTVRVYSSDAMSAKSGAAPETLACGGSLGYTPANIPAWKMTAVYCKSANGYMVGLPITDQSIDVSPVGSDGRILFVTNDCTGTAYIHWSDVGALGLNNGLVFSYQDATGTHVGSVAPQPSPINSNSFGSYMENNVCTSHVFTTSNTLEIVANDVEATAVQDAYTGPILIE